MKEDKTPAPKFSIGDDVAFREVAGLIVEADETSVVVLSRMGAKFAVDLATEKATAIEPEPDKKAKPKKESGDK